MEYILINENCELAQSEGELCVSGKQQLEGYLNSNKSNSSCFHCINDKQGRKKIYYRTGDQVRISPTGDLFYLGRIDQQVKINGYRVELGEIESVLTKIDGIDRAFVFHVDVDGSSIKKLAAYIVGNILPDEVLRKAKKLLPVYMLPTQIKIEKEAPLNSSGKFNKKLMQAQFKFHNI